MDRGRLLQRRKRHACLDDGSVGQRVEIDDPPHAGGRDDHRLKGAGGAAGNAGPPALRHDGDVLGAAQGDDRCRLFGRCREDGEVGGEIVPVKAWIERPHRVALAHGAVTAALDQALAERGHSGADRGAAIMEAERAQGLGAVEGVEPGDAEARLVEEPGDVAVDVTAAAIAPPHRIEPVLQLRHCPVMRAPMLAEQQPAARLQHPPQLAKRTADVGNAAGGKGENDGVGAGALEGKRFALPS